MKRFHIHRGINISHWLSQSPTRGAEREAYFIREDVAFIKEQGFDHIRLPVDEEHLWTTDGQKEPEAFRLLHRALDWCREFDLKCVVDLHILRSHHFNAGFQGDANTLFSDNAAVEHFADLWAQLSDELRDYPLEDVAYELLNEPVAEDPEDWNRVLAAPLAAVREREPERWVVVGPNEWQSPRLMDRLRLPEEDRRILLSFHDYTPLLLTHYRANWCHIGHYEGPVHYPGLVAGEKDFQHLDAEAVKRIRDAGGGRHFDPDELEKHLSITLAFAEKTGRPLYCGEFGCYKLCPREDLLRWTADIIGVFEKHGIAWCKWDYKGSFTIRDEQSGEADSEMLRAMGMGPS